MQIYIVEDSPAVRDRLMAMLGEVPGTEVAGAAGGATQATREILASRPEMVILDLNLAEGGGFDVLRTLHAQAPEIDVYMLSNFSADPYRQLAQRLGARGFFDKTREFGRVREAVAAKAKERQCKRSSS